MKKPEQAPHVWREPVISAPGMSFPGIKPPVSSKKAQGAFSPLPSLPQCFAHPSPEPSLTARLLPRDMGSEQGNRMKQCGRHAPSSGVGGWRNLLKPGCSSATPKPKQRDALKVTTSPLPLQTTFSRCFLQQEECERCSRPEE